MPVNTTSNTPAGVTESAADGRTASEGDSLEGITENTGDQTAISKVIRVTAEDFKTPCRGD